MPMMIPVLVFSDAMGSTPFYCCCRLWSRRTGHSHHPDEIISRQPPEAGALSRRSEAKTDEVQKQFGIAKDLKLLADSCPV
jgi:hypothetical protein